MSDLTDLRLQYHALIMRAQDVFRDVNEDVASQRPIPGRWSMAECVAHLNITGEPYLEHLAEVMNEAERRDVPRRRTHRPGAIARWLTRTLEPPYRLRVKTFTRFEPQAGAGLVQTLNMFEKQQQQFVALIDRMQEQGVPLIRVASPVQPLLRLFPDDWLRFLAAHARRHLWQAEQVHGECVRGY
ncbi:MAG: DinB family protein [Bacteroidota bacterium]|nr:DinB family protein [Bacteroidota bacterium]